MRHKKGLTFSAAAASIYCELRSEECGMGSGNGEAGAGRQRVEATGDSYGVPMEYLWNCYGIPMEQHASNTPATGCVLAAALDLSRAAE